MQKVKKMAVRTAVIWVVTGIALIIPNFTDFLNIAGSIGSAMIAFILPPLLYMRQFRETVSLPYMGLCWFTIFFGAAGAIYSTYYSIDKLARGDTS